MLKRTVITVATACAAASSLPALAAGEQELAQMREEIRQIKQDYEARIRALEARLQSAEAQTPAAAPTTTAAAFNPEISLILGGTYANLSQDPGQFRIQGFIPGGEEIGPGKRGFNLGESELTLRANVDPRFAGQLTFALAPDNSASVEEAFFETKGLANGVNIRGGRMLSSIGYLNSQHAHVWDFVDAPLAYQAFLGGQYRTDALQLKWLAPTDRFLEFGVEAGSGEGFPGNSRNRNGIGSTAVFAHVGDDIGTSASWRAGLSYLRTGATDRSYDDIDSTGTGVTNAFTGRGNTWIVDGVYKWSPDGNATKTSFKLQGEYFRRRESGTLTYDSLAQSLGTAAGAYASEQSGWYVQGVYQFHPLWRTGLRYDRLHSGIPDISLVGDGTLAATDFQRLSSYNPSRTTLMLDYSPSEFSRLRLQLARDRSRPEASDNQIFLQYIMSLGAHGAHAF